MELRDKRIEWACRRGMLELDLVLIPFYKQCYFSLLPSQQELFFYLLSFTDPELYDWLILKGKPHDAKLAELVEKIRIFIQTSH